MRDRAQQLHRDTELLRVLLATLLSEVDDRIPAGEDGRRARVLARMVTTTAADVSDELHRLSTGTAPADTTTLVQLPRGDTSHARTHPVFLAPTSHRRVGPRS